MADSPFLDGEAGQRAVTATVALVTTVHPVVQRYERELLTLFQAGKLMIDQVLWQLDESVYWVRAYQNYLA